MRNHIQGVVLLLILAAALWGTAKLAGPAFSDAIGDDGAVVAESTEDTVDLATADDGVEPDLPLTAADIFTIQWQLAVEGFLDLDSDLDGLMGPDTRDAMTEAKTAYGIPFASDRDLMAHLAELLALTDTVEPAPAG